MSGTRSRELEFAASSVAVTVVRTSIHFFSIFLNRLNDVFGGFLIILEQNECEIRTQRQILALESIKSNFFYLFFHDFRFLGPKTALNSPKQPQNDPKIENREN